jgi:hypothetical protein
MTGETAPPPGTEQGAETMTSEAAASEQEQAAGVSQEQDADSSEQEQETAGSETPQGDPWWRQKGFTSERVALDSFDHLRRHATQSSQELSRQKARADALQKIVNGEAAPDDVGKFLSEAESRAVEEIAEKQRKTEMFNQQLNEAIGVAKSKYPQLDIDADLELLNGIAVSAPPTVNTVMGRMDYACERLIKERGLTPEKKAEVQAAQQEMKRKAHLPSGSKAGAQPKKDYWDMTREEFDKAKSEAMYGGFQG